MPPDEETDSQPYYFFTGILGTKHIPSVLTEHGYHDVACTIAAQTPFPSWGH